MQRMNRSGPRPKVRHRAAVIALAAFAATLAAAQEEKGTTEPVAVMKVDKGAIYWAPRVEYHSLTLVVSGPGVELRREFGAGDTPRLEVESKQGLLPDGAYAYELRVGRQLPPRLAKRLGSEPEAGRRGLGSDPRESEEGPAVQSGYFTIDRGAFVSPADREPEPEPKESTRQVIEGDLAIAGDLFVKGSKSFVAADPDHADRVLVYTALEGPEAGTYFRGTAVTVGGEATIELPAHFAKTTEPSGLTVQLTPVGHWSRLYVADKTPRRLVVRDAEGRDGVAFDFLIQGVRRGYAGRPVVRPADAPTSNPG